MTTSKAAGSAADAAVTTVHGDDDPVTRYLKQRAVDTAAAVDAIQVKLDGAATTLKSAKADAKAADAALRAHLKGE